MKMKYIFPLVVAGCLMTALSSCEDMLDTKSDTYVYDNKLNNANDSLYSAMGIITQLQAIGERYVLLGELRGDLVTVPTNANIELQNVANFSTQAGGDFSSRRDWYSVINNCNYALAHMDTTLVEHNNKVLLPEYTAIRTLRAWVYLQMGLTFGNVAYITKPITTLDQAEATHEKISLDALVENLVADLEPIATKDVRMLNYGTIDGHNSSRFFIRPDLLLADLYLYQGRYEDAAQMYYNVINKQNLTMSLNYSNYWEGDAPGKSLGSGDAISKYSRANTSYTEEALSMIPYASDAKAYHPNLVNLTYNTKPSIIPSTDFMDNMAFKLQYHVKVSDDMRRPVDSEEILVNYSQQGDLRGMFNFTDGRTYQGAFGNFSTSANTQTAMIAKFYNNASENTSLSNPDNTMFDIEHPQRIVRQISIYRIPMVYLRYAEAVNRAGKPTLAFAVLKYGLNNEVLTRGQSEEDEKTPYIDPAELEDGKLWTDFTNSKFDGNGGSAMRGRGWGIMVNKKDKENYVIPEGLSQDEKIEWVENQILDEMAAETCFEGNRFFDLLRVARHRADFPKLLVDKISSRFEDPQAAAAKLADPNNWWVK